MPAKNTLKILFGCIFVALAGYNLWAGTRQPLLDWSGLTKGPDRYWAYVLLQLMRLAPDQEANGILTARNL